MNSRMVGLATLLVLVGVGQSVGSIVFDLSEDTPFAPLSDSMLLGESFAFESDPIESIWAFAWDFDGVLGYGAPGSATSMARLHPPDDGEYALVFGEIEDLRQPDRSTNGADIPFFAAPEPGTLIVWSVLGSLGFGLGWWRGRRHGIEVDSIGTSPYEPLDRHTWPEGTTEAILDIIDRGRLN